MNPIAKKLDLIGCFIGASISALVDWEKLANVAIWGLIGGAAGELGKVLIRRLTKKKQ